MYLHFQSSENVVIDASSQIIYSHHKYQLAAALNASSMWKLPNQTASAYTVEVEGVALGFEEEVALMKLLQMKMTWNRRVQEAVG